MTATAHLRREIAAAERIPYSAHVASRIVRTEQGDYLQAFRLGGASFESSDDAELNNWHERLNVLWRNIANPSVALWTHVIRRRAGLRHTASRGAGAARGGFRGRLALPLSARLRHETLMLNELYLVDSVSAGRRQGGAALLSRVLVETQRGGRQTELADALDACEKLAQTLAASLARYEPELLGATGKASVWYSSLLEYLGVADQRRTARVPLPRGPLNEALADARLFFGTEAIEYRSAAADPGRRRCSASRSTRRRRWSACTTGCCPRRSRSCSPSPSPF